MININNYVNCPPLQLILINIYNDLVNNPKPNIIAINNNITIDNLFCIFPGPYSYYLVDIINRRFIPYQQLNIKDCSNITGFDSLYSTLYKLYSFQ